jgi:short subunit fatty acids transporter
MNKFDKAFLTGLTIIGMPFLLLVLMLIMSLIGPPRKKEIVNVDKQIVYDTVKVKKVIYDTIRIKEKRINKTEEIKVEETKKDSI